LIFVDTWAWIALAVDRDQYHGVAQAQHHLFRRARRRYVTSDFVLSETISYLLSSMPAD
jgi:predicted nucleic acid-binding protein